MPLNYLFLMKGENKLIKIYSQTAWLICERPEGSRLNMRLQRHITKNSRQSGGTIHQVARVIFPVF